MKQEIETILASHLGAGQYEYGFADLRGLLHSEYEEACWNKCRELTQTRIDKAESICGICIAACPIGRSRRGSNANRP